MKRDGYTLTSTDFYLRYEIYPDDGICGFCRHPGPIVHMIDHNGGGLLTQNYLPDICERCVGQILQLFKDGNEA